jgi:hypothetical protein
LYHASHAYDRVIRACDHATLVCNACDRTLHRQHARERALPAEKEPDEPVATAVAATNLEEK